MKKVYKILFIALIALFCVLCSEASAKVKEDASLFTSDTYVIGSTKFDSGFIVTASRAATAGADEAIIQRDFYGNMEFESSEIKTYYYCATDNTWSEVKENGGGLRDLTETEVNELEESLNIFFVNNIEKRIEITFEGTIDENSITPNAPISGKATVQNNVISVPATWLGGFSFTSEGIEVNVELANSNGEEIEELENPVITISSVAKIGTTGYETLEEAIKVANEEDTVTLIQNVELSTAVEVSKKVTIDLNGYNLTMPEDTAGDGVFHVVANGDLTINGEGIVDGTGNNDWNIVIFAEGGKVTINGGTYTNANIKDSEDDHFDVIYAKAGGSVEINGGRFEGKTPAWLLNLHDGTRNESEIVVKGGTFVGFNPADNKAEGEGTNFVAEGYKVTVENDIYTVSKAN